MGENRNQIKENNKEINRLMLENELLIKGLGFNPPVSNYVAEKQDRLCIPTGYIRTSNEFHIKYHLSNMVLEKTTKKNISYSLQMSDFFNYLVNRFNVWGSVGNMLYKHDFVNLISIIESLLLESASNISNQCKGCPSISKCKKHVSKTEKNYTKQALDKLCDIGILRYSQEEIERINELINLRNRIHIRLSKNNEFLDDKFNLGLHNETIKILIGLADDLNEYAVPYYTKCIVQTVNN